MIEILEGNLPQEGRIVDQNIYFRMAAHIGNECVNGPGIGQIAGLVMHHCVAQLCGKFTAILLVCQDEEVPVMCKPRGNRGSKTSGGARNDNKLAGRLLIHAASSISAIGRSAFTQRVGLPWMAII